MNFNFLKWIRRFLFLVQKELFIFCKKPSVYIASTVFSAVCALNFFVIGQFFIPGKGSSDLRLFFSVIPYISALIIPFLTMDQWNTESNIFDQILPITETQIVLSKWVSCLIVSFLMLLPTLSVPIYVNIFGTVDLAQVITGYTGIIFFQFLSCALGVFLSALCKGKVSAYLLTTFILLLSCFIHYLPVFFTLADWIAFICRQISFSWHFDSAGKGIIDTRDFIFYSVFSFSFLAITIEYLKIKKRGCI